MRLGGRSSRKDSRQQAQGITGTTPVIPFQLRDKVSWSTFLTYSGHRGINFFQQRRLKFQGPQQQHRDGGVGGDFVGHAAHVPGHFAGAVGPHNDEVIILGLGEGNDLLGRHPIGAGPIHIQPLILEVVAGLGQKGVAEFLLMGLGRFNVPGVASPIMAPTPL